MCHSRSCRSQRYEYFIRSKAELSEALETLVYWNQEAWESNQSVISRLINVSGWPAGRLSSPWCFGL
jgi:hypothetical protein